MLANNVSSVVILTRFTGAVICKVFSFCTSNLHQQSYHLGDMNFSSVFVEKEFNLFLLFCVAVSLSEFKSVFNGSV